MLIKKGHVFISGEQNAGDNNIKTANESLDSVLK
jgi:hypothetical protein